MAVDVDDYRSPDRKQTCDDPGPDGQPEFQQDWRSPEAILTEFLGAIELPFPSMAARSLIDEFGGASALLAASWWELKPIVGMRAASIIRTSHELMQAALAEPFERGPVVPRSRELIDFLRLHVGCLRHECLLALYVDSQIRLIRIRKISDGGLSDVPIDIRRIISFGLSAGASGILLVHNHPSGDPAPSRDDLAATSRLQRFAEEIDLHLLDHLIIAGDRVGSVFEYWQEQEWKRRRA